MTTKLKIKCGDLEVECEGEPEFISSEVPKIIDAVAKLFGASPSSSAARNVVTPPAVQTPSGATPNVTTKALVMGKGLKKGPDLVKAALAYLHAVKRKETATRSEILDEMRTVTTVYRTSMEHNFPRTVNQLLAKREINEPSSGVYVLSDSLVKSMIGEP